MAATATRAPTSDDAVAGTWTGSAGSRFGVVDDYPDTAGTDELTHGTTAGTLTFGFSAFAIPSSATNISVFVDYYDYKNGSQGCTFGARLKVGGNYYNAATHNPANGSASRTQRTDTWATNPKTSAAWTPAQINRTDGTNDLQAFGFNSGSDASPTITTSSVRVRVTYDATHTITAASGTVTVTGYAASLKLGRKIVAAAGSVSVAGYDASILVSTPTHTIVAEAGAVDVAGYAASLKLGRRLVAAAGSVTPAGYAAALRIAHRVAAAAGSVSVDGYEASITITGGGEEDPSCCNGGRAMGIGLGL